MDDDPEREEPAEHRGEPPREAQRRDEADDDDGVEQHARVAGIAEHLEQDADQHRADHDPALAAGAAEDHHRVDRDQEREREREREDAGVQGADQRAAERGDRGAEREAQQLEPVDGHSHHLGRERVLAERAPRATRAGEVDEAQQDVDDDEERERHVEVGDVEDAALARDVERAAEEAERVDVEQAVRAARDVVTEEVVAVRRHGEEELQEEERHDREVVAC